MGIVQGLLETLFGNGRNVIRDTAEVFRVNAEQDAVREAVAQQAALGQFGTEFRVADRGWFDRLMDALNRIPRPAMALGTMGLFVAAMVDPVWFAARMAGIALVPEPLWWLLGAIVSFYFGARHQAKGQEFQREIAVTMAAVPQVVQTVRDVEALRGGAQVNADAREPEAFGEPEAFEASGDNAALNDWRKAS